MSTEDWIKGISLSVLASIIGAASKLAIRKSWLIQQTLDREVNGPEFSVLGSPEIENYTDEGDDEGSLGSVGPHGGNLSIVDVSIAPGEDEMDLSGRTLGFDVNNQSTWVPYFLRGSGMFGMTFLNPLCGVLAMTYASPSIITPFSGLTLVWIVLFSGPVLKERPSTRQLIAAALIITGEVVVAAFGDHKNDEGISVADVVSLATPLIIRLAAS